MLYLLYLLHFTLIIPEVWNKICTAGINSVSLIREYEIKLRLKMNKSFSTIPY